MGGFEPAAGLTASPTQMRDAWDMPVQDDARENQMVDLFNLSVPVERKRADVDALLELEELAEPLQFELKSTTGRSVSTVRDFGPEHIAKWRDLHWLFAFYGPDGGRKPLYCSYASPADMAPWVAEKERYVRPDLVLAQRAPQHVTEQDLEQVLGERDAYTRADAKSIMKNQWSAAQYRDNADLPGGGYSPARMLQVLQERCGYVIRRGATLNNPHIPGPYLAGLERIERDHAPTLRRLVRAWLTDRRQAQERGESVLAPLDPVTAAQASAAATDNATA